MAQQEQTISHTGDMLGPDAVSLYQNQVSPRRETEIAEFECPDKFERITFVAERDPVRFEPRTKESFDGDGNSDTFQVDARIRPVAGEAAIDDQPYPAVIAVADGNEVAVSDIDYATGEVTLSSTPSDGTGNVHLFPAINAGTLKMRGLNSLGQNEGPLFPFGHRIARFNEVEQDKRGTEVNLSGSLRWGRNETLQLLVDSPEQIVWEDDDYPGAYVSTLEIDCSITF